MRIFFTTFFALVFSFAFSQNVINVEKSDGIPPNSFYAVGGEPFVNVRFVRLVEGTPYFKEKWMKGVATSGKGEQYQNSRVKLDLFSHELHYLNDRGDEFICTIPMSAVELTDTISGEAYYFVLSSSVPALQSVKKGWYRPLAEGKALLFQFFKKTVQESKPYSSPVAEQRIITAEEFVLVRNGTSVIVKKPKELLALLSDRKAEMENFFKENPMKNSSNEEQMTAAVAYYNTLF